MKHLYMSIFAFSLTTTICFTQNTATDTSKATTIRLINNIIYDNFANHNFEDNSAKYFGEISIYKSVVRIKSIVYEKKNDKRHEVINHAFNLDGLVYHTLEYDEYKHAQDHAPGNISLWMTCSHFCYKCKTDELGENCNVAIEISLNLLETEIHELNTLLERVERYNSCFSK